MVTAIGIAGWLLAACLAVLASRQRRRLELVAEAAHELRGPVAALAFAVAWLRREAGGGRRALRFEAELERMRAGLADLDAAREGRRAPGRSRPVSLERLVNGAVAGWRPSAASAGRDLRVNWEAGRATVRADRGRLAQALGNLMANAVEHGSGPIEVCAIRKGPRSVRVEVRDGGPPPRPERRRSGPRDRGHGLGIAERVLSEAGGRLELERGRHGTVAAVELPLVDEDGR